MAISVHYLLKVNAKYLGLLLAKEFDLKLKLYIRTLPQTLQIVQICIFQNPTEEECTLYIQ